MSRYKRVPGLSVRHVEATELPSADKRPKKIGPYCLLSVLGRGAIGKVYRAFCAADRQYYAVKRFVMSELARLHNGIAQLRRELTNMRRLSHPNILGLKAIFVDKTAQIVYAVLPYADCGSLENNRNRLAPDVLPAIFKQILDGLVHLHECGLVHQDIKPSNLLLSSNGRALISDFGLGHSFQSFDMVVGSPAYQAPELTSDGDHSDPSKEDVWSLGVSLYQTVFKKLPYDGENVYEIVRHAIQTKLVIPPDCDGVLRDLLHGMLEVKVANRFSAHQALEHPWFDGTDNIVLDFSGLKLKVEDLGSKKEFRELPVVESNEELDFIPVDPGFPGFVPVDDLDPNDLEDA
jgi:serine/threonine-protein kinase 11